MEKEAGVFQAIRLAGQQDGLVKRLSGFDKSRHVVPKYASDRAAEFLGRICQEELSEWADEMFRELRQAMGYKRRDLSLECENGLARLVAKDFVLERRYSLVEESPEYYDIDTELSEVPSADLFVLEAFNGVLGPLFDRMCCVFRRAVDIEDLIDGIEDKPESGVTVEYPGDCAYCEARIRGCDAVFHFDSAELQIRFPVFGSPAQLYAAWQEMEKAFVAESSIAKLLGMG